MYRWCVDITTSRNFSTTQLANALVISVSQLRASIATIEKNDSNEYALCAMIKISYLITLNACIAIDFRIYGWLCYVSHRS